MAADSMIVMKFGGTSLGSAQSIVTVAGIVEKSLDRRPVLIVSAHSGVTDQLADLSRRAPNGDIDCRAIATRHREILSELGLDVTLLDPLLAELEDLARGMKLVGEASARAIDYLLSFGERCSSRTVAALLTSRGVPARAVDAFDAGLRTDSRFGRARPLPDDGRIRKFFEGFDEVPVVTGFIGGDEHGNVTTLGRNGSDLSAALFGNALDAEEIQIWTDVEGVMTADPSIVPGARRIEQMSFDEASELAYYGGKVLHPATLLPAMAKEIPVRVSCTHRPDSPGTIVTRALEDAGPTVRSIVYKEGVHLVSVVTPRMLQQHGYLAELFGLAAEHEVVVDLIATSEVSVTMTVDDPSRLPAFTADLESLGDVSVEGGQALVCVVGHGMARVRGVAADVLGTLKRADVRVRVISQGAIRVNVALVIDEGDLETAVRALHDEFFGDVTPA